ncbi:MAG: hypothetical protein K2Y32_03345 [Candidatus Obscuribacterales bacterium]|nr:hypothetical protein [Candidatus Obscuribacterales bacterium]
MDSTDLNTAARLNAFLTDEYIARRQELFEEFNSEYPDDDSCWRSIFSEMKRSGLLRCKKCGSEEVSISADFRVLSCTLCKRDSRATAGTFFHGVKKIRAWLFAIWIVDNGFYVSSKWLASAVSVAQSSALHIIKSALVVVGKSHVPREFLGLELSLFWRFFDKRTVLTQALRSPKEELNTDCRDRANAGAEEDSGGSSESDRYTTRDCDATTEHESGIETETEKASRFATGQDAESDSVESQSAECQSQSESDLFRCILSLLEEAPRNVDTLIELLDGNSQEILAVLTELEFTGQVRSCAGGLYERVYSSALSTFEARIDLLDGLESADENKAADEPLKRFQMAARCFFRVSKSLAKGIGRKYLSLYMTCANEIILGLSTGRFLGNCVLSGYVGSRFLRRYCSALQVGLAPCDVLIYSQ